MKRAYLALRPFAQLFGSLLQLAATGHGCAKLRSQPVAAVAGVQERLRVEARGLLGADFIGFGHGFGA